MNFDTEKLFAKVAGENVENFANCVMSDSAKAQINFAFNQIFQGLSFVEWMRQVPLMTAWDMALNKMYDFVFSFLALKSNTEIEAIPM